MSKPQFPVVRFCGSPDSNPADWLRINHLTKQPGLGSAYKITIEPMHAKAEIPTWFSKTRGVWVSGISEPDFITLPFEAAAIKLASGQIAVGSTRENAVRNFEEFQSLFRRGPR